MPCLSQDSSERSLFWLKVIGLTAAVGLHAGVFAFIVHNSTPQAVGEPTQEEIIGVSLLDFTEVNESMSATAMAEQQVEETVREESEPEPEPEIEPESEFEAEPEPEPEPEPVIENPISPEPVVEKPKPKPRPQPQPKSEPKPTPQSESKKVAEVAAPAAAPTIADSKQQVGGQQANAAKTNQPRIVSQVNYLGRPPSPVYPRASQRRNEQGKVVVRVVISTEGTVEEVWVKDSSGHPRLDEAALSAVRKVKFKPYTENGIAFKAMADIPFDFVL